MRNQNSKQHLCFELLYIHVKPLKRKFYIQSFFINHRFQFLFQVFVSSPKQAAAVFTPASVISRQYFTLFWEVWYFLDLIPPLLLYIKPPLPINKQFSIDSFLDWEGLHWDFSSTFAYPPSSVLFSAFIPTPKHQTHWLFCRLLKNWSYWNIKSFPYRYQKNYEW